MVGLGRGRDRVNPTGYENHLTIVNLRKEDNGAGGALAECFRKNSGEFQGPLPAPEEALLAFNKGSRVGSGGDVV